MTKAKTATAELIAEPIEPAAEVVEREYVPPVPTRPHVLFFKVEGGWLKAKRWPGGYRWELGETSPLPLKTIAGDLVELAKVHDVTITRGNVDLRWFDPDEFPAADITVYVRDHIEHSTLWHTYQWDARRQRANKCETLGTLRDEIPATINKLSADVIDRRFSTHSTLALMALQSDVWIRHDWRAEELFPAR